MLLILLLSRGQLANDIGCDGQLINLHAVIGYYHGFGKGEEVILKFWSFFFSSGSVRLNVTNENVTPS